MTVPRSHPRYLSLMTRDKLVEGFLKGLAAPQGLIAHGRGEAFDYLLGEETCPEAREAIAAAAYRLLTAQSPVVSVNGNVATLCPEEISQLCNLLSCPAEVNLFHRSEERVRLIAAELRKSGCERVTGEHPDSMIPGLDHSRALASGDGMMGADVALVPLEDGDRCEALKAMGKFVITIDLNPLSRTARKADISIIDNITRALPELREGIALLKGLGEEGLKEAEEAFEDYDNERVLAQLLDRMTRKYLSNPTQD
ncbi:MAG: phosphopantothenate/pantothenate synthetase [Candidatus Thermoplasmatota archaeon]|nr:phosphopantothenate/pantothenate synthetase [Candidatus Thermoplasmatota archaeon]